MNSNNSNSKNHKPLNQSTNSADLTNSNYTNSNNINLNNINSNNINPGSDNFFNKKKNKKRKNRRYIDQQINEEYENYLESQNYPKSENSIPNMVSQEDLNQNIKQNLSSNKSIEINQIEKAKSYGDLNKVKPSTPNTHKNFYKLNNNSKSLNNLKIKEIKDSIRKSSSQNIVGDIFFEVKSNFDETTSLVNKVKKIKSSQSIVDFDSVNKFSYLIGDSSIDIENYENYENYETNEQNNYEKNTNALIKKENESKTNKSFQTDNKNNKNSKNNKKNKKAISMHLENVQNDNIIKFEDIENIELKINETADYHLINTPFKMMGEELLNEEINNKYKPKVRINPENNQIIKKLKDVFKKLVYSELKDKPNISQILLDNQISDEIKVKILRKYIKFTTEDEIFSEEADKIKIEIKNLLKQKKLRVTDDYDELGKLVEEKNIPGELKTKLEDIYYRVIAGDQPKLHNLLNNILKLPWEKKTNILEQMGSNETTHEKKVEFIKSIYSRLDTDLYGLEETKDSIMSWICQKINNPDQISNKYLCLCGPAGVGKTSIVHSISEVLGIPYSYISLANIDEPGSLIGHGYTYEGSQYGSIAGGIIKNKCTNGILLFDELDKAKEKVQNTLLGIFDPLQNKKFRDAYFGDFYLNLSESLMIICLNNLENVNPILKDRLHIINIPGYSIKDKKIIVKNYILPRLKVQYNLDIQIEEQVIDKILEKTKHFQGIRQIQMYLIKIYELAVLDKYICKYNFNNIFTSKHIDLLNIVEQSNTYLTMFC